MKKIKTILFVLLILSIISCLSACSSNHDKGNLKDNLINGCDRWIQSFSKHALTKEKDLQGEKGRVHYRRK